MSIELGIVLSILGFALAATTFFIGRTSAAKSSGQEWGAFTAELKTDVKYIKNDMSEIKAKIEIIGEQQAKIRTDVEVTKRDLKTAFSKIDELRGNGRGNQ